MPNRNPFLKRTIPTARNISVSGPVALGKFFNGIGNMFERARKIKEQREDFDRGMGLIGEATAKARELGINEMTVPGLGKITLEKGTNLVKAAEIKAEVETKKLVNKQGEEINLDDLNNVGASNTSIKEKAPDVTQNPAKPDSVPVSQGQGTPIPVGGYWSQKPKISFEPGEVKPEMQGPFPVENPFKNLGGNPPEGRRAITADEIFKPSQKTKTGVDSWFASMGLGANEAKPADPVRRADLTGDTRIKNPQLGDRNTPVWDKMFDDNK